MPNPLRSIPLALLVSLGVIVAACQSGGHGADADGSDGTGDGSAEAFAPVPVEVDTVRATDLRRTVSASTTLRSAREVSVVAEIAGTVREVVAQSGDRVEAGALLARIVNDDVQLSLREAEAAVDRTRREVERLRPLFDAGYLARQTFEAAEFELETAESSLARLRSQGASQAVRAAVGGVVISRTVEVGAVVVPNQSLFVVADIDSLEARVAIPERELAALREGQPAEILVEAYGPPPVPGTLSRIEPTVDPRTGTIEVRVALAGVEHAGGTLRPGMFVGVRVVTDVHRNVPAIPKRAVVREGGVQYVFVLHEPVDRPAGEGSAEAGPLDDLQPWSVRRVVIELGYEDRDLVEVLGGIEPGERVVVVGQSGLDEESVVVVPSDRAAEGSGADG